MGCSCSQKGDTYTIDPTTNCIFCANKHISIAYTEFCKFGLIVGNTQVVLGELELAFFHLMRKYTSLASEVAFLEQKISRRMSIPDDAWKHLLSSLEAELNNALQNREQEKPQKDPEFSPSAEDTTDVFLAEREFSSAWRLATECGYADANRLLIIGQISAAQLHIYRMKCSLAEKLRDLRHLVADKKEDLVSSWWIQIARDFDELIRMELSK